MENKFKAGQEVWIHFPWVDAYCWYKGITRELGTPQLYSLTNSAVGGTTSGTGLPTSALYQPLCQLLFRPLKKYRFSVAR